MTIKINIDTKYHGEKAIQTLKLSEELTLMLACGRDELGCLSVGYKFTWQCIYIVSSNDTDNAPDSSFLIYCKKLVSQQQVRWASRRGEIEQGTAVSLGIASVIRRYDFTLL